jgi:hypothetical protein
MATIDYFIHHQCAQRIQGRIDVVILQVNLSFLPTLNGSWIMTFPYGENLIEDPGLFYNADLINILFSSFGQFHTRKTGVPYLEFTDHEWQRLKRDLEPGWFYSHFFFYRYFVNTAALTKLQNWKSAIAGMMYQWEGKNLPTMPSLAVSSRVLEDIVKSFPPQTKFVIVFIPDIFAMQLANESPELQKKSPYFSDPKYRANVDRWIQRYAPSEKAYLELFQNRLNGFIATAHKLGVKTLPGFDLFASMNAEDVFFDDLHHLKPAAQERLGKELLQMIQESP